MSRRDRRPEALVLDEGVLREGTVCEIGAQFAVEAQGGVVVTPWRDRHRAAEAAELSAVADPAEVASASHPNVVVNIQKSRAATASDLAEAWRILAPGGQLLLAGPNTLGITSAVKRLAKELDQEPIVASNRAKSRIVRFKRDDGPGPAREATPAFEATFPNLQGETQTLELATRPGVFSAKKLDAGSQLLLDSLAEWIGRKPPKRLVDLGCGTGVLGLAAAHLCPDAECLLVDADARAVACARENVERLGLSDRVRVEWWDAREKPLGDRFDVALVNPPFHQHGPDVDLGPALALFSGLGGWLGRQGRALVVANRTLPYEQALEAVGELTTLGHARGYKLLSLRRSARSSGARGRTSPGARSGGRSRPPTRSR